jgi:hypothetical protein
MDDATERPARPPVKRAMRAIRRLHLYFGLLLFPWAVLYGVTAFLFNHPSAFADAPTTTFGPDALAGTPFEDRPTASEMAEVVVARLNVAQKPATPYVLSGEAKFTREFAFATVKAADRTVSVLMDVKAGSGTIRSQPNRERPEPEKPPFVADRTESDGNRTARPLTRNKWDGFKLANPMHERIKASIPAVLERYGFPSGDVTVTSVPDIQFPILADNRVWVATYNPMTHALSGASVAPKPESELSVRRFLLRLHSAHGYPGEMTAKWYWAVVVDVMAFVMCFWGLSGLAMWWQLKSHRKLGFALLATSAIAATALGYAMHAALTG